MFCVIDNMLFWRAALLLLTSLAHFVLCAEDYYKVSQSLAFSPEMVTDRHKGARPKPRRQREGDQVGV